MAIVPELDVLIQTSINISNESYKTGNVCVCMCVCVVYVGVGRCGCVGVCTVCLRR